MGKKRPQRKSNTIRAIEKRMVELRGALSEFEQKAHTMELHLNSERQRIISIKGGIAELNIILEQEQDKAKK